jgi:8-amino-7-oxononanoate synthase
LLGCVAQRGDIILYDELCHASIIDGIRLSFANSFKFRHNDLKHLEERLKKGASPDVVEEASTSLSMTSGASAPRSIASDNLNPGSMTSVPINRASKGAETEIRKPLLYVVAESVYSMDGDLAPIAEMVLLCTKYNARLILDEAHATGIYGEQGRGRGYESRNGIFARVITFGKALGVHGAAVAGSAVLRDYLINYARPFIYSTALPFHSLVSIGCAYEMMMAADKERSRLTELIYYFRDKVKLTNGLQFIDSNSPIQGIIIPGNDEIKRMCSLLQDRGFDVRPVLSPTVPAGKERIRVCLHSYNSEKEIDGLVEALM